MFKSALAVGSVVSIGSLIGLKFTFHSRDDFFVKVLYALLVTVASYTTSQFLRWQMIAKLLNYRNWIYQPKSFQTKIWGMMLRFLMPKKNKLYDLQKYLPKYPLPKLEDTCQRTLSMVKPLLNDEEYKFVAQAVEELRTEGQPLQKHLECRYKSEENWLTDLWDKFAYLAGRSPLPVYSNFATLGDANYKAHVENFNQLSLASNLIHQSMEYKKKIDDRTIDTLMIMNIVPMCCDRYKYVFSTTRLPGEEIDKLVNYPKSEHIVVFRNGFLYKIDVRGHDKQGRKSTLTPKEIQRQLQYIVDDASDRSKKSSGINPGIFTTMNRSDWAKIRKRLTEENINSSSLETVESAVFCVSLDSSNPENLSEEFHNTLAGNGFNRWFDKSLNIVVTSTGSQSINVEHTTAEATFSGRMWEYAVCIAQYDDNGDATDFGLPSHDRISTPKYIEWNLDDFKADLERAQTDWEVLNTDLDALIYFLQKGKRFIKKLHLSPDGFMQMAIQLAFYRLHKETPKTYETASTRLFKFGRTETIRSVSQHSVDFTKTFDDPSVSRDVVVTHLKNAISYQTMYKYDAMNGKAVDRHLFALYATGKICGSVPKLFSLKPFNEYDRLSTSQSPLHYDLSMRRMINIDSIGGGFGPQRQDGYGVSYFMEEEKVNFLITSFKSCAETESMKFAKAIEQAVDDMKDMLESSTLEN